MKIIKKHQKFGANRTGFLCVLYIRTNRTVRFTYLNMLSLNNSDIRKYVYRS